MARMPSFEQGSARLRYGEAPISNWIAPGRHRVSMCLPAMCACYVVKRALVTMLNIWPHIGWRENRRCQLDVSLYAHQLVREKISGGDSSKVLCRLVR